MRGGDTQQGHMWSYLQPEQRVPQVRPLRPIRAMVNQGPSVSNCRTLQSETNDK